MKVFNALELFLQSHPNMRVVESYSSAYHYKVLEYWEKNHNKEIIVGRDRHGLHCAWVLENA